MPFHPEKNIIGCGGICHQRRGKLFMLVQILLSSVTLRNKSVSALGEIAFVFNFGSGSFGNFDLDTFSAVFNSPVKPMSPQVTLGGHLCVDKLLETRVPERSSVCVWIRIQMKQQLRFTPLERETILLGHLQLCLPCVHAIRDNNSSPYTSIYESRWRSGLKLHV